MSKVINPTDSAIEIQYRGVKYAVDAGSSTDNVPAEAAEYWKTSIHNFIVVVDDEEVSTPVKEVVEIPEEIIVPREDVVAELGEEAVAAIEAEAEVSDAEVVVVPSSKKSKK